MNSCEKNKSESQRRKRKIHPSECRVPKNRRGDEKAFHLNAEFQRIEGEIRKPSYVIYAKKQRKTIEWERLEISSRKSEIPKEYFMQR